MKRIIRSFGFLIFVVTIYLIRPYLYLPIRLTGLLLYICLGHLVGLLDDNDRSISSLVRSRAPRLFHRFVRRLNGFSDQPTVVGVLSRYLFSFILVGLFWFISEMLRRDAYPSWQMWLILSAILAGGVVLNIFILLLYQFIEDPEEEEEQDDSLELIRVVPDSSPIVTLDYYNNRDKAVSALLDLSAKHGNRKKLRLAFVNQGQNFYWDETYYNLDGISGLLNSGSVESMVNGQWRSYVLYYDQNVLTAPMSLEQLKTVVRTALNQSG